jgi:hypothetical protein
MPITLCAVRSSVPKSTEVRLPKHPGAVLNLCAGHKADSLGGGRFGGLTSSSCPLRLTAIIEKDQSQPRCKLEDRVRRRRSWNTWIVTCGLIIVIAALLFLEHYLRRLHSALAR